MFRFINKPFKYISKKCPILIQTPRSTVFGNCAEEMFYGLLRAKRENKRVLFLYPKFIFPKRRLFSKLTLPTVANQELLHVQSQYSIPNENIYVWCFGWLLGAAFTIAWGFHLLWSQLRRKLQVIWPTLPGDGFFDPRYRILTIGRSALWKPDGVDCFSWQIVEKQNWEQQFREYTPPKLNENKHRSAEQLRVKMGIPLADWFVCLHVRESGFHKDSYKNRNASIQNYIEGIKVITAAGGWVVRLGDSSMTPLPPIERVVDYPHTRYKSELMDIYLISQCRFFVGTNSGPSEVSTLFKKPTILVNLTAWTDRFPLPFNESDLATVKHLFSRSHNRFLSLEEILEDPSGPEIFNYSSDECVLVENTAEEIRDVIEEFLKSPENHEHSELQKTLIESRRRQIRRWFDQQDFSGGHVNLFRIAGIVYSAAGTLGQMYLEQNWFTDSLEKSQSTHSTRLQTDRRREPSSEEPAAQQSRGHHLPGE